MDITASALTTVLSVLAPSDTLYGAATASHQFSPSVSQVEACNIAEEKAKIKILQTTIGEDFFADVGNICGEKSDLECNTYSNTFQTTRGYFAQVSRKSEKVENWVCTVNVTGEVKQPNHKYNSLFDMQAKLNRFVYTNNDTVSLTVEANAMGIVNVFYYDPKEDIITKVFPIETSKRITVFQDDPLRINFPVKFTQDKEAPQVLFVTMTDGPVPFMNNYKLNAFYQMWDRLPYKNRSLVRKSFIISRREQ